MKYLITQPETVAGIGHQFHNWALGLVVSDFLGCEYLHTKINSTIRNKGNRIDTWPEFLNINKNLRRKEDVNIVNTVKLPPIELGHDIYITDRQIHNNLLVWKQIINNHIDNTLFILPKNHYIGCLSKNIYDYKNMLINSFWENKTKMFDGEKTIGIHIRRGDINKNKNIGRWRDLMFYKKVISHLKKEYDDYKIYIFSEGKKENFKILDEDNVFFILSENDIKSFLGLCSVDILVTGLSSFSIMASYFNHGIIYYDKLKNFTLWENFENYKNIEDYV